MARKRQKGTDRPRNGPDPVVPNLNPATPDHLTPEESPPFPIVAIGASAGGLQAVSALLRKTPADTGMAFVVVMHLDPTHESMLAEILGRETKMPVRQADNQLKVEPDHVYVNRPNTDMVIGQGMLQLSPRTELRGQHQPIDRFMRSLAEEHGYKSIGVVLSGSSADGTHGLDEIKAAGGITFAQDSTAEHSIMPRSAIASGSVDFVLPADAIGQEIGRISRHPYVGAPMPDELASTLRDDGAITRVLELLRQATGVDFTNYKRNTLHRRVTRRMVLNKLEGLKEYERLLEQRPEELLALYQDILINVTSFFRNPEAYEALKTQVYPRLVAEKSKQEQVRVWTMGCSTGEEAYSIAMSYLEYADQSGRRVPVQIFATDLNAAGIERARAGIYPKSIVQDVSPERLRRFFIEVDGSYRVCKPIRDMCVFARQNVLADPPFSNLDLLACRNMLIYLDPVLQQRVVPLMHYALRPGGYLWLGSSETVGSFRDLFHLVDARHKVYERKPGRTPAGVPLPPRMPSIRVPTPRLDVTREAPGMGLDPAKEADRLLLGRYAPPAVVLNRALDIVQFRGDTTPYLMPAPGRASHNLLKMLREGLLVAVRGAVHKVLRDETAVREDGLRVKATAGGWRPVSVLVMPLRTAAVQQGSLLVVFEEPGMTSEGQGRVADANERARVAEQPIPRLPEEDEVHRLEQELAATRDYLQSVIEQQEAANEELQSANEEVQSANEELQSINEELETSKEEIQSTNEELATVNDELQDRNLELSQSNNDLTNLLSSVQLAIVMLGPDLRIRRVTPGAEKLLNLIPSDVGRPISDIKLSITVADLDEILKRVIDRVEVHESEVQDKRGQWYSLRVRPYRTSANAIEGAVIVLVDVDSLKRAEASLRDSDRMKDEFLATLSHELRSPLAALHSAGELINSDEAGPSVKARAKEVLLRQSHTLARLVDDLLDLSRITHGQVKLQCEPTDIAKVARNAVDATEYERQTDGQLLELSVDGEPLIALADPMRLEQVFRNLLSNATKFTPDNGRIWMALDREPMPARGPDGASASAYARVRVRDNGAGIGPEMLTRVFEMFTQGQPAVATPAATNGMGLGLALAKQLVELHGGTIEARSEGRRKGSEFVVRIPLIESATARDRESRARAASRHGPARRLLVVEDNADTATLIAEGIRTSGHEVRILHNGASALEVTREFHPDVVLLDIGLPDVDGYEVAQQIRADRSLDDVRLIALTGYGRQEDIRRSRAAGIDEHLVKPVDAGLLQEALERAATGPTRH